MTELIWEGKYKDNKKTAPARIELPFQTIETVNESAQQRQRTLDLFASGRPTEWRNRIIWGDKKYVLPSLLPEFAGEINLIYIDPPFDTGADFSFRATIPDNPETEEDETTTFVKQASIIEQKAYRDTWGRGLESYLQWFYETIIILHELLTDDGCIYVHLDWHISSYAKTILDEVFGYDNFINDIVWQKIRTTKGQTKGYGKVHDVIFFYKKGEEFVFNKQFLPIRKEYIKSHYKAIDEKSGRRYRLVSLTQAGQGTPRKFGDKILEPPKGKHWVWSQERIDQGLKDGTIVFTSKGTPSIKRYLDEAEGDHVQDIWVDIYPVNAVALERTNYATQKPESLLERIIEASSNENDLILDCFVGSGTTAVVAEKLNRRWIACDLSRFAIHTTRKRLLGIENIKPFVVLNLGKYEVQQWIAAEFSNPDNRLIQEKAYRNFILDLFHAQPISGYNWLHGVKSGRIIHVGSVDAPISLGDVKAIIQEFWKTVGKSADIKTNSIDILGWDFAFEINEIAKQFAKENKVDLKFKKIPREVLDKKAVEQGDIKFFEMACLDVDLKLSGKKVTCPPSMYHL